MWPSFETASSIFDWANWFLLGALAIGVVSTGLVIWMGNIKEEYLRRELAATGERTKVAEQRAAEATLALEKFKAPRLLLATDANRIANELRPFAGTPFDMSVIVGDPEAMTLLLQIAAALRDGAGWSWVEWNHPSGPFMTVYSFPDTPNIGQGGTAIGIRVQISEERKAEFGPAAAALIKALTATKLEVTADAAQGPDVPNNDTIHIRVGKKPQ
jgi:hypothetical protein